jgi:endonuclease YncB( thermonuclease family)
MKRFNQIDWEFLLAVLTVMMLVLMAITILPVGLARASACLSIDVPPQAVLSVHDGDTFTVFSVQPGGAIRVRVQGANTPELSKRKGEPDEPGAVEAREFTKRWLNEGVFSLRGCGKATLDRTVWSVSRGGSTLAQDLAAAGLVK